MSASSNAKSNSNAKASSNTKGGANVKANSTITEVETEEMVTELTALQRQIVDLLSESKYIGVKNVKGVWQFMEKGKGGKGKSKTGMGGKSPALLIPFEPHKVDMTLCHAIVSNNKLFTQCQKKPDVNELYCNYCLKNGKEGTVEDRLATGLYMWMSARGVRPSRYVDVLKTKYKENWETMLTQVQDHLGFALNAEHLVSNLETKETKNTSPPGDTKEVNEEVVLDDLDEVFITVNGLKKKYLFDQGSNKVFGYVSHKLYGVYDSDTDTIVRNKTAMLEVDDIIHDETDTQVDEEVEVEEEEEVEVNEDDYMDVVHSKKLYKVNKTTGEAHTLDKDGTLSVPKFIYNFEKQKMCKLPTAN